MYISRVRMCTCVVFFVGGDWLLDLQALKHGVGIDRLNADNFGLRPNLLHIGADPLGE